MSDNSSKDKSSKDNLANENISPETIAVINRAKKSFLFSISLLIIGLIIVAIAIIYRDGGNDNILQNNSQAANYSLGMIVIPEGAQIISVVPSEGMIGVSYILNGKEKLRLIDGNNGAIIRDIDFVRD